MGCTLGKPPCGSSNKHKQQQAASNKAAAAGTDAAWQNTPPSMDMETFLANNLHGGGGGAPQQQHHTWASSGFITWGGGGGATWKLPKGESEESRLLWEELNAIRKEQKRVREVLDKNKYSLDQLLGRGRLLDRALECLADLCITDDSNGTATTRNNTTTQTRDDRASSVAQPSKVYYWEKGTGYGYDTGFNTPTIHPHLLEIRKDLIAESLCIVVRFLEGPVVDTIYEESLKEMKQQILNSCIPFVLENYLANDSLLDIFNNSIIYHNLLLLLVSIGKVKHLRPLLFSFNGGLLYKLFLDMAANADEYLSRVSTLKSESIGEEMKQANKLAATVKQTAQFLQMHHDKWSEKQTPKKERRKQKAHQSTQEDRNSDEEEGINDDDDDEDADEKVEKEEKRKTVEYEAANKEQVIKNEKSVVDRIHQSLEAISTTLKKMHSDETNKTKDGKQLKQSAKKMKEKKSSTMSSLPPNLSEEDVRFKSAAYLLAKIQSSITGAVWYSSDSDFWWTEDEEEEEDKAEDETKAQEEQQKVGVNDAKEKDTKNNKNGDKVEESREQMTNSSASSEVAASKEKLSKGKEKVSPEEAHKDIPIVDDEHISEEIDEKEEEEEEEESWETLSDSSELSDEEEEEEEEEKAKEKQEDGAEEEPLYNKALKKHQMQSKDLVGLKNHHYQQNILSERVPAPSKMMRLVLEMASLRKSLPLSEGSSVFICTDSSRLDVMKALITGPEGTPYSGGCFEFDIYFPSTYPNQPPLVNLCTTGNGSVRFNPNLYNCGKVCLSLLGTWGGGEGENWDNRTSTLLQVLVSIQALIFVPEPYFNEPGYESSRGTPWGDSQSKYYTEGIRVATMQWAMTGQLRNKSSVFADVIRQHFTHRRDFILAQCEEWLKEGLATESHQYHPLRTPLSDLRAELEKLS
ncbi:Baculoviral IAP repeat-containing protein 6 [Balamuthia mandrillaris]